MGEAVNQHIVQQNHCTTVGKLQEVLRLEHLRFQIAAGAAPRRIAVIHENRHVMRFRVCLRILEIIAPCTGDIVQWLVRRNERHIIVEPVHPGIMRTGTITDPLAQYITVGIQHEACRNPGIGKAVNRHIVQQHHRTTVGKLQEVLRLEHLRFQIAAGAAPRRIAVIHENRHVMRFRICLRVRQIVAPCARHIGPPGEARSDKRIHVCPSIG